MKNKTKCFAVATAVLLTLCLVFAAPVGAAEEESNWFGGGDGTSTNPYLILTKEQFANISKISETNPIYLKLGNGISIGEFNSQEYVKIGANQNIILDLNGNEISAKAILLKNNAIINVLGKFTLTDDTSQGSIKFSATDDGNPKSWSFLSAVIMVSPGGECIINGGILKHEGGTEMSYGIDVLLNSGIGDASLTVNGGYIESTYRAIRLFANSKAKDDKILSLTINGGSIFGSNTGVWIQLPGSCYSTTPNVDVKVIKGAISSENRAIYSYSDGNSFANTHITINDGTFNGDVALSGGLDNYLKSNTHNCLELDSCLKNVNARALETVTVSGGTFTGKVFSNGVYEPENKKQAMGPFITGGTFGEDPSEYVNTETYEAVLSGGKYVVAEKGSLNAAISAADIGFDSVKVGYTQPAEKIVTIKNDGQRDVTLNLPTSEKYDIALSANTLKSGETVDLTIQPKENLPVGNYAETITVTTNEGAETTFKVSFLVYQPSSGGSSKPVEEPVEPEIPEEPEVPTEEPEAGEVTVETEVTDGGEVEFEAPVEEPEAGEVGTPAVEDEAKITGVVLPTGTDSEVTFVPVSEQAAPEGKETQTKKVFEINVPTYEKGKPATIKFTMTVAELAADGKEAADVALWHFDEETGEWTKLVTSYTIVDGVVYFEAITNDFSPFAIVYEDEPVDEPVEEPETPASPAPVLGLIAALGAAVVLRRK